MTGHDKIEHLLPNGDILIIDSTQICPEVEAAFAEVRRLNKIAAVETYRRLQQGRSADTSDDQ